MSYEEKKKTTKENIIILPCFHKKARNISIDATIVILFQRAAQVNATVLFAAGTCLSKDQSSCAI